MLGIRLVILDADESLWRGRVGLVDMPFKKLDENTISSAYGQKITLFPKTRELLARLRDSKIAVAMASWNEKSKTEEALRLFEILEFFPEPVRKIWWERGRMKHLMIQEIIGEVRKSVPSLEYSEVLFYDDDQRYFEKICSSVSPDIHCIQAGVDLKIPYEILGYIESVG